MIKIKNLVKNFGARNILNIDTLDIEEGKVTALVGENGLGKSTLFNIVAGLDKEYSGSVEKKVTAKEVTLLQHPPLLLDRSVEENILYPLKIRKVNQEKRQGKTDKLLKLFKIEYIREKNALSLSSGERQKVALARALSFDPKLLLLDEPASNLDANSIEIIETAIKKFNTANNSTILLISHDKDQVERLAHKIIYLKDHLQK